MTRFAKQLLFAGIYLALFVGIVWGGYELINTDPTCSDGLRNGGEEGVDCGAVCGRSCPLPIRPLENEPVMLIENSDGSWDILAHLENMNGAYGVERVDYTMTVKDAAGASMATRRGNTYVNPAQPRYLVFPLGRLDKAPASASLTFDAAQVRWAALTLEAAGSVEFAVTGENLMPASGSVRYEANLTNRSRFDFNEVDVTVLLYDASGDIVGAGPTIVRTLRANELRGFVVDWPFAVPGATRAEAVVGTNIFANENYIREYGRPQEF